MLLIAKKHHAKQWITLFDCGVGVRKLNIVLFYFCLTIMGQEWVSVQTSDDTWN
jgi:hypothetical protein